MRTNTLPSLFTDHAGNCLERRAHFWQQESKAQGSVEPAGCGHLGLDEHSGQARLRSNDKAVYSEPRLLQQGEKRKELSDRLEPLRATIMSSKPPVAPIEDSVRESHLADHIAAAERVVTRADELQSTARDFANYLAGETEEENL